MKSKVIFKRSLLCILSLLFVAQISAQNVSISGVVRDAGNGEGLPGATVAVQGTAFGTVTDIDGNFTLEVSKNAVLIVSFVGYEPQQVLVTDQLSYEITLSPSTIEVDELVVIGYGKVKKSDATGSVQSVSSRDFNKGAITSPQELLIGKSAGVVITSSGGAPGSGSTIRIRGGSSLNASNDPLIIVDGVPIDNNNVSGSSNFLSFVNPNDIESMTVLKDASATAIYGSRASNGVIIITTKTGLAGRPMSISYNGNTSMANSIKFVDVYTGDELRQMAQDNPAFSAADASKLGTANTNWQDEIFRTAFSQDHNLSVSGSVKSLPYRASVGYTDQNGIMKNTDMQRITGSINLNPSFLDNDLKVNINVKAMNTNNNFGDAGALGSAVNMDPTQEIYDDTAPGGYFQWSNYGASLGTANPVEQLLEVDNRSVVNRAIANVQVDYSLPFLPGLRANLNMATDFSSGEGHNNRPVTTNPNLDGEFTGRQNDYTSKNTNDLIDFYLNYNKDISDEQNIDVTAGYSWQHFAREGRDSTRGLVPITDVDNYVDPIGNSWITENYLVSFFGRVNYSLLDKYLFTATIRNDGSSRFAEGNRWGLFPSVAVAWKINNEAFLSDVDVLSNLKLRLSWGITGQQDIGGDYPAQALYIESSPGFYYPIGGTYLATLRPNPFDPNIKWEETTTQNLGLDFGFYKGRVAGSVDVYHRVTEDLLNTVTVPTGSNLSNTLLTNVGSLENTGAELALDLIPVSTQDMNLTIGFNATYNVNNITKLLLTDDPEYIGILYGDAFTGQKQVTRVGYPAYSFFVNKQVYNQNDEPLEGLYVDLSGEGGVVNGDNADKYIFKNPAPDFLFGLSARFNYKTFDISASARAAIGNYVYNQVLAGASYDQMFQIGYWKNNTSLLEETKFIKRQFTSDYFVENASYLKLDNISAGYTFENIADKMSARISFTVQNALIVTKYKGIDPEVNGGIDNNFYPRPRTFMIGLSLTY